MFKEYLDSWFLILFLFIVIYWYFNRNFDYWSKRGIKGPNPKFGFGTLLDQFIQSKPELEIEWFKKYGKIYGVFNGNSPTLRVAEPELIKQILVKDFHLLTDKHSYFVNTSFSIHPILKKQVLSYQVEDWRRVRSIVTPTLSSGKIKKMYPIMKDCFKEFQDTLEECAKTGRGADMKDLYGKYTMDVMASWAFATKSNAQKDPDNPFVRSAFQVFNAKMSRLIPSLVLPKFILKMLKLYSAVEPSANQFFIDMTRRIIKERQNCDQKYNDFIQLLLNSQKNSEDVKEVIVKGVHDDNQSHYVGGEYELNIAKKTFSKVTSKFITEDEILAQALLMFIAGYEPTSTTLTFASHALALNPDIQERLYEEIMTAVDDNGDIGYDSLLNLPYLESVISETLRMHPPDYHVARKASVDYDVGSTGLTIRKGELVEIPIFAMHHYEEFHPDPFRFNPDRFMPKNRQKLIPYSYLPFGAGPRQCLGMRFALIEIKVGLAQVIRRFKLTQIGETDVPCQLMQTPFFRSPRRAILGIEKRV